MSKVIKVEDHVYQSLDLLRVGRQTFSDVIEDLLNARVKMFEAMSILEGQLKYREWQREQLEKPQSRRSILSLGVNTGDDESP